MIIVILQNQPISTVNNDLITNRFWLVTKKLQITGANIVDFV